MKSPTNKSNRWNRPRTRPLARTPRIVTDILDDRRCGVGQQVQSARRVLAAWQTAVGEQLASRTAPLRTEGQYLIIGVTDTIWIQEIEFLSRDILERLRDLLPDLGATRIRCEYVHPQPPPPEINPPRPSPERPPVDLAHDAVSAVRNPHLKAAFERLQDQSNKER